MSEFSINEHELDREWLGQADLFYEYAIELADAKRELEEAKSDLEVTRAELILDITEKPEKYGIAKTTKDVVEAALLQEEAFQTSQSTVFSAKHKVDVLQAAVNTMEHRKRALENLVTLHGQNYFSEPRGDNRKAVEESVKADVRTRRKKRRQ